MKSKKSQSAIESIAIYGWAILIGVIAAAILAYFGVFKFEKFSPRTCTLETGVSCQDFFIGQYESGNGILRLNVKNNMGDDIVISSWEASSNDPISFACSDLPQPTIILNGESAIFDLDNCNNNESGLIAGKKAKVNLKISYYKSDSQIPKDVIGTVLETVEHIGSDGLFNQTQCSDTLDNDANLCKDFAGGDTGCSSSQDTSEAGGLCPSEGGVGMAIYCYVSTVCDEATIFRISALSNAHAEIPQYLNYNYNVCCRSENDTISNLCTSPDFIPLRISNVSNAHAEKNTQSSYGTNVCISAQAGAISCTYSTSECLANEACLATISSDTSSHIGDCVTAPYQTRICCTLN